MTFHCSLLCKTQSQIVDQLESKLKEVDGINRIKEVRSINSINTNYYRVHLFLMKRLCMQKNLHAMVDFVFLNYFIKGSFL